MAPDDDSAGTATLESARAHARAQAAAAGGTEGKAGVTIPASSAQDLPAGVDGSEVTWDETIPGANYASRVVRRDEMVRITDLEGDACVQLLLHRWDNPAERLNVADTVKVQWQAYPGRGAVLLSDMGRALATIVADTSERHDFICGTTNRRTATERWGEGSVGGPTPNGRDLLVLAIAKHGLGRVDAGPCAGLFKGIRVAEDGSVQLHDEPVPGAYVELRAEMDLLVSLAVTPHPLDERPYTTGPVRVTAWRSRRPEPDPFRSGTPERLRAFENTEELLAGAAR